jgi:hypothetical protein
LDPAGFAAKTPVYGYWIRLDFLGFSRPNQDLSMGYAAKTRKIFSRRFFLGRRRRSQQSSYAETQNYSLGKP